MDERSILFCILLVPVRIRQHCPSMQRLPADTGWGILARDDEVWRDLAQLVGQEGGSREGPVPPASALELAQSDALHGRCQGGEEAQGLDRLSGPELV